MSAPPPRLGVAGTTQSSWQVTFGADQPPVMAVIDAAEEPATLRADCKA